MTGTAVTFSALDWAVVALYFVANTAICIWCALQKEKDTTDYFLASRSAGWFLIGSSIFASNIGAEHLIGLAGSGADSGMAFAHWELHSYLVPGARLGVRAVLPARRGSSRRRNSSRSATRRPRARSCR